jgi:hypothetical protein
LTRQYAGRNVPVAGCIGEKAIGREELGLAEARRDDGIFDASVLMDRGLGCGQCVLKPRKSRLESCMADDGLIDGMDGDDHHEQGLRGEWSGVEGEGRGKSEGW